MKVRWYPTRRVKRGRRYVYERLTEQGFDNVADVMDWLGANGFAEWVDDPEGRFLKGWGDPFFACTYEKSVAV